MIYDINRVYLYEVFDDYKASTNEEEKKDIWNRLCNTIWKTQNQRKVITKNIGFKILEHLPNCDLKNIFDQYSKVSYLSYQRQTSNKNPWYILRQKINNIYSSMCDIKICLKNDYYYELNTAKRLYFNWIDGVLNLTSEEVEQQIKNSIIKADELHNKYSKQKINISWNQYKELINSYVLKCLNNYIPLDDYEDKNKISLYIDFWQDDNYVIGYIGRSLSGYMRNYQKEHFGVSRKNGNDKRKYKQCEDCGKWFLTSIKANRTKRCNVCYKKERQRINKEYYKNKIKTDQKYGNM